VTDQIYPIPTHSSQSGSIEEHGKAGSEETWENEGGQMSATFGRIISTPDGDEPYMVILSHHERADSQQAFASMRAAEAYIRRNTPRPSARSTFWDRDAPKPQ
jgi:hypothetical protein